jgi:serine protease
VPRKKQYVCRRNDGPFHFRKGIQHVTSKQRLHTLAAATALALATPVAFAGQLNTSGLRDGGNYDRFIVRFQDSTQENRNPAALKRTLAAAGSAQGVGVAHLRKLAVGADVFRTDRKLDKASAVALMRRLANNPNVVYVEVDKLNRILLTPNDTRYSEQWQYFNATGGIKADEAWNLTTGVGSVVAVLDTGITTHSDIAANLLPGYDFIIDTFVSVDGDGRDSNPADPGDWNNATECDSPGNDVPASNSSWHGTHVTGTVAAVTNNAKGVAGTAYGAKVVPVRVLGKCGGYDSDIADAMVWASGGTVSGVPANANPAEVVSLSLGGGGACGATTQAAIDGGVARGTTFVIAAGNDNADVSGSSPANCNNVIAVGSTTSTGARSSFSNYGSGVDIAAPGSSILSTLNAGAQTPGAESYASYSGTSMATPHVAGVVALMQAYATTPKTPAQIEALIKSTARAFPVAPSQPIGAGIINARAAVEAVNAPPPNTILDNGVPKTGLGAATGASLNYTMAVPAGATGLKFVMSGGTGDADMYVKFGSAPTDTVYDCRPYVGGNAETCTIATAQAGTYYVRLKAYSTFSGVSLTGSYSTGPSNTAPTANFSFTTSGLTATFTDSSTDPQNNITSRSWNFGDGTTSTATNPSKTYAAAGTYTVTETVTDAGGLTSSKSASVTVSNVTCGGLVLCSGTAVTLPSVATGGVSSNYTLVVPAGKTSVVFTISGGTGDADMYVRIGAAPTTTTYNCRPYTSGNAETCTFNAPAAGTYYVNVRAYAAYSGVSLKGTISP